MNLNADERGLGRSTGSGKPQPHGALRKELSRKSLEAEVLRLSARVEELERERDELEASRGELEEFLAMAAHELLKPLLMTDAYARMILDRAHGLDIQSKRDLHALAATSSRGREMVETLLNDAWYLERPLRMQQVDLADVVAQSLEALADEASERRARIDVDPMPVVRGNAPLLGGVFRNLLSNALKYGPRENADIHVSVTRSEAGWIFAVQSSGAAIDPRESERLFEPWTRGRDERRASGTGLGLAIVRRIVERHGGQVGVAVANEASNRFYFTLPA